MINISNILDLANYAFVLFFGITASFYFVGIHFGDYKKHYVLTIIGFGIPFFRKADIIHMLSAANTSSTHPCDIFCFSSEYLHVHHFGSHSLSAVHTQKMDWNAGVIIFRIQSGYS